MVADKTNAVTFKVLQDATKPEIKAAVELMFKVEVKGVSVVNTKGKTKRFGQVRRSSRQRSQGLRDAQARSGAEPLRGGRVIMAVIKMKPTSPGHRGMVKISRDHLHKGEAYAPLLEPQFQQARAATTTATSPPGTRAAATSTTTAWSISSATRTASRPRWSASSTTRTARPTSPWCATPTASAATSSLHAGLEVGATLISGSEAPIRAGNTLPVRNIPVGSTIHCIELKPGKGAQIARSAGTSATLLAREGTYAQVRMRSGEVRKIHIECRATIGEVANEEHSLRQLGKAGVKRHMGIRPTVRGVVMNPVDHPHGGGEGKTGEGRHPVDPWGNLTKGYRTRNNKRTQVMVVSRRKK